MQKSNVKSKLSALEIIIGIVNIISAAGFSLLITECCREMCADWGNDLINIGMVIYQFFTFPLVLVSPLWVRIIAKKPLTVFSITTYGITAWLWVVTGIIGWFVHG